MVHFLFNEPCSVCICPAYDLFMAKCVNDQERNQGAGSEDDGFTWIANLELFGETQE